MTEIYFVKQLGSLKPAYDADKEKMNRLPKDQLIKGNFTVPRNGKFHRKLFALLNLTLQAQDHYKSIDNLREDLIKAAGYFEEHIDKITGEITRKAKSISWAKMDELEFQELYDKICDIICHHILIDVDNEKLQEAVLLAM